MSAMLPRALMALAAASLGEERGDWGRAMQAELEAVEPRDQLSFAAGCLVGAWREMPRHAEGRFLMANHLVALGLILPMAALLLSAALLGYPFIAFSRPGAFGFPSGEGAPTLLLNAGNISVAPSLSLLVMILTATHLLAAWQLLERDWSRATMTARLGAAATTTLLIFSAVAAIDPARMVLPVGCVAVQSMAIAMMGLWHGRLREGLEAPD